MTIIKNLILFFGVFLTLTLTLSLSSTCDFARAEDNWRKVENRSFPVGEKLEYVVKWGIIKVGYATLEVKEITNLNGRSVYHIYSQARTAEFFDNFYKVRDTNESWIDTESICSWRYEKHLSEGRHKSDEKIIYDQINHFAVYKDTQMPIPPSVQDILSSLYWLRTQPLEVGEKKEIDVNTGKKNWPLVVKVLKKTKVKITAGEFDTIIVEPFLRAEGIFQQKGRLKVWLTDDTKKIPVLMSSKIFIGAITAELEKWQEK